MTYLREKDFPEWMRLLMNKLTPAEKTRLLYPHPNVERGRQIQETIIQVLQASCEEGEEESTMLQRLNEYANTDWP